MKSILLKTPLLLIMALLLTQCNNQHHQETPKMNFSYSIEKDAATGWDVITLAYTNPDNPRGTKRVKIVPQAGNNLYSLFAVEQELLYQPATLKDLALQKSGIPILYPTPNRVKNAVLKFGDLELKFAPNNGPNFIHGLVRNVAWKWSEPQVSELGVTLKTWIDFTEDSELYQKFPFKHRFSIDYLLLEDGIQYTFRVENQDEKPLPFGIGLHPYFQILGDRDSILIKVPALNRMEAIDLLPTGQLLPMDSDPEQDLSNFVPLSKLKLDDVFWGMSPIKPAVVQYLEHDFQITFETSTDFTHAVVYTPEGREFFCLENQTCSTDAHNLYEQGFKEESHLMIVEPQSFIEGFVKFEISGIK